MSKRIDYEYELSNGWDRLGMMVLTELKRLADGQDELAEGQRELAREVKELQLWQAGEVAVAENQTQIKRSRFENKTLLLQWAAIIVALLTAASTLTWLAFS